METKKLDFGRCLIDPTDKGSIKKFISQHDRFLEFEPEIDGMTRDSLMIYAVCMYDLYSPLRKEYPDYLTRKIESSLFAGFKTNQHGQFDMNVDLMLRGKNKTANELIVKYIFARPLPDYIILMGLWDNLSKVMHEFANENKADKQKDQIANMKSIRREIEEIELKIFGQDNEKIEVRQELHEEVVINRLMMTPEERAKKQTNKKGMTPYNPYA